MTVQKLIDELMKINNKNLIVYYWDDPSGTILQEVNEVQVDNETVILN